MVIVSVSFTRKLVNELTGVKKRRVLGKKDDKSAAILWTSSGGLKEIRRGGRSCCAFKKGPHTKPVMKAATTVLISSTHGGPAA